MRMHCRIGTQARISETLMVPIKLFRMFVKYRYSVSVLNFKYFYEIIFHDIALIFFILGRFAN
jgi:hypothetical protein